MSGLPCHADYITVRPLHYIYSAICILLLSLLPAPAASRQRLHKESWYQVHWCDTHNGHSEVTLSNGTRADCLTDTHAIEVDFADKWRESIGQALSYAYLTDKDAGIVLIIETPSDNNYLLQLQTLIDHFTLPITIYTTTQ